MKLNNQRGAFWFPIAIFLLGCLGLRASEDLDHNVINKEKYKTQDHIVQGERDEWVPKFQDELKIEANDKHDAKSLPAGVRVDMGYKAPVE